MAETLRGPKVAQSSNLLGVNKQDRVHVFIDATNLLGMCRAIDRKVDFKLFMQFLKSETRLIRAGYYAVMRDSMSEAAEKVIDMIEYAGFDVVRKWGVEHQEGDGQYKFRGSLVPEMTVAMIDAAENGADHIIVISGDGDLTAGVEAAKQREARVTVIGVERNLSDDLRRSADAFIELSSLHPAGFFFQG